LRSRQQRNFIASLLLSQGVPMLLAGDELGRSQQGNNNAYCQDNELSWVDWTPSPAQTSLLDFARRLTALRAAHPVFRRRDFFQDRPLMGSQVRDIVWLQPDGSEMSDEAWQQGFARALAVFLSGDGLREVDGRGRPLRDDSFLLLFNAAEEGVEFTLPASLIPARGVRLVDTSNDTDALPETPFDSRALQILGGRSLVLVRFDREVGA